MEKATEGNKQQEEKKDPLQMSARGTKIQFKRTTIPVKLLTKTQKRNKRRKTALKSLSDKAVAVESLKDKSSVQSSPILKIMDEESQKESKKILAVTEKTLCYFCDFLLPSDDLSRLEHLKQCMADKEKTLKQDNGNVAESNNNQQKAKKAAAKARPKASKDPCEADEECKQKTGFTKNLRPHNHEDWQNTQLRRFEGVTGLSTTDFWDLHKKVGANLTNTKLKGKNDPLETKKIEGRTREFDSVDQLLLFLIWLKHYPTIQFLSWIFETTDSVISTYLITTLEVVSEEMKKYIQLGEFEDRKRDSVEFLEGKLITVVFDGSEQQIMRASDPLRDRGTFSGKKKLHTNTVLLVVSPQTGKILYISNSYPGGINDIGLCTMKDQREHLFAKLTAKDGIAVDRGFAGIENYMGDIKTPVFRITDNPDKEYGKALNSWRTIVENAIAKVKGFNACSAVWRSPIDDRDSHHRAWIATAGLVNLYRQIRLHEEDY